MSVQLLGLQVRIVFDQIYGLAYLSPPLGDEKSGEASAAITQLRLSLMSLHMSIRSNSNLNELLMELYGEDMQFKETEMATFTV